MIAETEYASNVNVEKSAGYNAWLSHSVLRSFLTSPDNSMTSDPDYDVTFSVCRIEHMSIFGEVGGASQTLDNSALVRASLR